MLIPVAMIELFTPVPPVVDVEPAVPPPPTVIVIAVFPTVVVPVSNPPAPPPPPKSKPAPPPPATTRYSTEGVEYPGHALACLACICSVKVQIPTAAELLVAAAVADRMEPLNRFIS
jgi:hypothetical protein